MEKGSKDADKNTTVLYKKSMSTIRRHSRTTSLRGQPYSRSGKHHVKQRTSREHEYYNDGVRVKRDLSIETDICKMRNSIRHGLNKESYQDVASLKSKFSAFADGDSLLGREESEAPSPTQFQNADVVSLIVDNFRGLLNKWIREYLLDSSDNLQKIEAIRESLLRKFDKGVHQASQSTSRSRSMYKMHKRKARMRGRHVTKDTNTKCEPNCSNYTVPFQSKQLRIISTLSLPRNIDKSAITYIDETTTVKNLNRKNFFVALKQPKELLADSTFILVTLSSRSFTKRCVNYKEDDENKQNESSHIKFQVKHTPPLANPLKYDQPSKLEYDALSIVKNIYGDIQTPVQMYLKDDKNTMTEEKSGCHHDRINRRKNPKKLQKFKSYAKINNVKYKHFTYLYRKAGKKNSPCNEFVNHFQNIISCFNTYEGQKHITLDVHFNVLPVENAVSYKENVEKICAHQLSTSTTNKTNCGNLDTLMEFQESESSTTKASKSSESENRPEIISLLDGSESKGKYIVESENNSFSAENVKQVLGSSEPAILDNKLNICHQIDSLKNAIKGLTLTAEKLIIDHLRERINTSSTAVQVEPSQCDAAVDMVQSSQNTNTPMNVNSQSYEMWFSQNPVIYNNTLPSVTQQLMNSELENYKMSRSSELTTMPNPLSRCNPNSDSANDLKPIVEKEIVTYQSKGIQFSCNLGRNNTGLKLQTLSKNVPDESPPLVKKPSFCYIESESVLKVTDMTSKCEIPTNTGVKEIGLTCSFPNPPPHLEVANEKMARNTSPFVQNSVKLYNCGDGFNKSESKHVPYEHESCKCNMRTSATQSVSNELKEPSFILDQEKSIEDCEKRNLKSSNKPRCFKYFKICLYGILLCVPIVAVTIFFADIKEIWQRTIQGKSAASQANTSSDLRLLLAEFGF